MSIRNKALSGAITLALAMGLSPAAAFAAGADGETVIAAAQSSSLVQIQSDGLQMMASAKTNKLVKAAVKACDALPSADKVKFSDNANVRKALYALSEAVACTDMTDEQKISIDDAYNHFKEVYDAMNALIKSETAKAKKAKVSGVAVKSAKGKATVSWKKLAGGTNKYEVYYSLKKGSGFKKAGTTKNAKLTVKKLTSGKTYYFKVRAVRTDIPEAAALTGSYKTVNSKYSTVAAKKVK